MIATCTYYLYYQNPSITWGFVTLFSSQYWINIPYQIQIRHLLHVIYMTCLLNTKTTFSSVFISFLFSFQPHWAYCASFHIYVVCPATPWGQCQDRPANRPYWWARNSRSHFTRMSNFTRITNQNSHPRGNSTDTTSMSKKYDGNTGVPNIILIFQMSSPAPSNKEDNESKIKIFKMIG